MSFVDRQGSNLNRRRLDVISTSKDASGNITQLTVDMERADEVSQEGTPLNAAALNNAINNAIRNNPNIGRATAQTANNYDSSSTVATTQFVWNVLVALGHARIMPPNIGQNPPRPGGGT